MKNIVKILYVLIIATSCKAQVIDIAQQTGDQITGAYYKDTQSLLNTFEGTYLYTDGLTSLKIIFQKKVMSTPANNRFYEDLLIGEYQYVENGVEKSNTLSNLNTIYSNGWKYSIDGNSVIGFGNPGCNECLSNEKALKLGIVEDSTNNQGVLYVRKKIIQGQQAIEVTVEWEGIKARDINDSEIQQPTIPNQTFILIKQ